MSSSSSERILRNGCGGGDLSAATAKESNSASPEVYIFVKDGGSLESLYPFLTKWSHYW